MKHIKKISALAAVLAAGLLASCGQDNKEQTQPATATEQGTTEQGASQQVDYTPNTSGKSTYIKDFNPTESFIKFYDTQVKNEDFDFNSELPLSGRFNSLLNRISSLSRELSQVPEDKRAQSISRSLLIVAAEFTDVVNSFKKDLASSDDKVVNAAKQELVDLKSRGVDIDLEAANPLDLISQFAASCKAHNNYQTDINKVLESTTIPKDANADEVKAARKKQMEVWNTNFSNTCGLVSQYNEIISNEKFDKVEFEKAVKTMVEEREKQIAQAKARIESIKASFKSEDTSKDNDLAFKACSTVDGKEYCTTASITYDASIEDWMKPFLLNSSTVFNIFSPESKASVENASQLVQRATPIIQEKMAYEFTNLPAEESAKYYPEKLTDNFKVNGNFGNILSIGEQAVLTNGDKSKSSSTVFYMDKTTKEFVSVGKLLLDDKQETINKFLSVVKEKLCSTAKDAKVKELLACSDANNVDTITVSNLFVMQKSGIELVVALLKDKQSISTTRVIIGYDKFKPLMNQYMQEQFASIINAPATKQAPTKSKSKK